MPALAPKPPNPFSGVPLDRCSHKRRDEAWLAEQMARPEARFHVVREGLSLVRMRPEPAAHALHRGEIDDLLGETTPLAFLGLGPGDEGPPHFALDLSALDENVLLARAGGAELLDLRRIAQVLPGPDAALIAYARALMHWHLRHRFCGTCGAPTRVAAAGHERKCVNDACNATQFPRTDAAVIVLVHDGGSRCLLCRQSRWPPGMHSTLAGFLEPGESLEEAVRREMAEESGLIVADVRYHSSQPWAFPGSLMVGFFARAVGGELSPDLEELEYAHWYEREALRRIEESDRFRFPNAYSIARRLIEDWLGR